MRSTTSLTSKKQIRSWIVKLLHRTRLNKIAHHIYYQYIHSFDTANRDVLPAVEKSMSEIKKLGVLKDGDYFEFGVFKGYTFWYAQKMASQFGLNHMRFFGFDSFNGLPEITQPDQTSHNEFYQGQFRCSKHQVKKNLNAKGVDWSKTFLIEGYFDTSLTQETKEKYSLDKASIALIDCDLYASTVDVLEFLEDLLADGTILMFDDWNCFNKDDNRGQRRAFREFLESQPEWEAQPFFPYGLYGQVFIMRNKALERD